MTFLKYFGCSNGSNNGSQKLFNVLLHELKLFAGITSISTVVSFLFLIQHSTEIRDCNPSPKSRQDL
uniref:Uncharacterized protein n=1 Tax=Helianthus annuus TaxID=4232 RepID=A0A251VEP9_HELAN